MKKKRRRKDGTFRNEENIHQHPTTKTQDPRLVHPKIKIKTK